MTETSRDNDSGDRNDGRPQLRAIPVEEIDSAETVRPVDPAWAFDLAHRMMRTGQEKPVVLWQPASGRPYGVIDGAHRVAAARRFSALSPLAAIVLDTMAALLRAESIAKTVREHGVSAIVRQRMIAELFALRTLLAPGAGPAADHDWVAELCGCAPESIEQAITRHRRLAPHVIEMVAENDPDAGQLEMLSRCSIVTQEKTAYLLLAGATHVGEALAELRHNARPRVDTAAIGAFVSLFEKMNLADKEEALIRLRRLLPAHVDIRWGMPDSMIGQ
ncbi:MAG: ParB N-terminal domain-containing protein [Parasphingopyxis sp.]|uniref:hypothetical protein n=1 Tax=Parasphingopyxis sp. TaxID=1920299 RepID=UPI0032EE031B